MHRTRILILLLVPASLFGQAPRPQLIDGAVIHHRETTATLTANDARPLRQAIEAMNHEYGWLVDYEDPPYKSHFDLVDATDPSWRASHPTQPGASRIAGGAFESSFPVPSSISTGNAEEQVLQKVVADYNASGNPGKFVVRKEAGGRYAVIGTARRDEAGNNEPVDALLDIPITIPLEQRDALKTFQLIVTTLSAKTGVKMYLGTIGLSSDPLMEATLTLGGSNIPVRTLLLRAIDDISNTAPHFRGIFLWEFLYDAEQGGYRLGLDAARRANPVGTQTLDVIDRPRAQ